MSTDTESRHAAEIDQLRQQLAEAKAETEAVLKWLRDHGCFGCSYTKNEPYWAVGANGCVWSASLEGAVRKAAGLDAPAEGES